MIRIILLLLFITLAHISSSFALSDSFVSITEDLINEKMDDQRIRVEVYFDDKEKLDRIKRFKEVIENVLLSKFDNINHTFEITALLSGHKKEIINGRYISCFDVPITTKTLRPGDIITSADLKLQKIRVNKVREEIALTEKEILGLQAKKIINIGSIIKITDLARPSVIKANDPVNIVYSSNNLLLKTTGIAIGVGAIGDTIKVKNEDTGNVLLGEIINKNTVQVSGE